MTTVTINNLATVYPQIKGLLHPTLQDDTQHQDMLDTIREDSNDPEMMDIVHAYINAINTNLKQTASSQSLEDKTKKTKEKKPATAKPKKVNPKKKVWETNDNITYTEASFARKYVRLHGKELDATASAKSSKTWRDIALALLRSLQKAIQNKTIRKSSVYASDIMHMQTSLIKMVQSTSNVRILIENIERYEAMSHSEDVLIPCIRSYISLVGSSDKEKARSLLRKFAKQDLSTSNHKDEAKEIMKSLQDFVDGKTSCVKVKEQSLRGLCGIIQ